ncbi:acid-sensing ion channel 1-like [Paramuricea clavata]|uniref:Acid-sensing ion channel 1-like n=1 Tax=Paramuricea clavata TaxID=317549 RepID=A0A6S7IML1_PARCT|nr:acid-sensing ion channel 1-like [Paramuricea clavata]
MMDADDVRELNGGYKNSHLNEKKKSIWDKFIEQSTLHGLHYLFEKRPAPQRIIWLILQGLMCALFLWQTLTLALDYLEYNVTSTIEFVTERESNFPAVTLCNFNQYRNSVLSNDYPDFLHVLQQQNPLYEKDKKPINWTKYANTNNLNMKELVRTAAHQMQYDNKTEGGMLYRCTWLGDECKYSDFTTTLTDMGLCYTFNAGM